MLVEQGVHMPVGYGAIAAEIAAATGCFYEERRQILQATEFVLKPDGTIAVAVYSTGPIGRLAVRDVLSNVRWHKKQL
jgi:hypothetical protein